MFSYSGLNPLIYTISAVILLGTFAIVVIITCWIRARRSFNTSTARPNGTAQDYLDYINDEEFTPLTSSEFIASLQERPPSYQESERMEQNTDSEERESVSTGINVASLVLQLARSPRTRAEPRVRLEPDTTARALEKSGETAHASGGLNSHASGALNSHAPGGLNSHAPGALNSHAPRGLDSHAGINPRASDGRIQTVSREIVNSWGL